jgi:hypothetical protein
MQDMREQHIQGRAERFTASGAPVATVAHSSYRYVLTSEQAQTTDVCQQRKTIDSLRQCAHSLLLSRQRTLKGASSAVLRGMSTYFSRTLECHLEGGTVAITRHRNQ